MKTQLLFYLWHPASERHHAHFLLSKVTVSELIRECNINRNTFYYHFSDIYDLLKWMFEQESIEVVKRIDLLVDAEAACIREQ